MGGGTGEAELLLLHPVHHAVLEKRHQLGGGHAERGEEVRPGRQVGHLGYGSDEPLPARHERAEDRHPQEHRPLEVRGDRGLDQPGPHVVGCAPRRGGPDVVVGRDVVQHGLEERHRDRQAAPVPVRDEVVVGGGEGYGPFHDRASRSK